MRQSVCFLVLHAIALLMMPLTASAKPVNVALVFNLSGQFSAPIDIVDGFTIAHRAMGEDAKSISYRTYDAGGTASSLIAALKKAIDDGADIIVGQVRSSKAAIAAEYVEKAGKIYITPFATAPAVTAGKEYAFRLCFDDRFQGAQLAKFAMRDLKAKTAVVIYDETQLYSQTLAETFSEALRKDGGSILETIGIIPQQMTSFDDLLAKIKTRKPDLVFLPTYEATAAKFVKASMGKEVGKLTILGGDGWGSSAMFADIIYASNTPLEAYWPSHYSGNLEEPEIAKAAKIYEREKQAKFGSAVAIGMDSARFLVHVLTQAKNHTKADIAKTIRREEFVGLTGTMKFKGESSPEKSLYMRKIGAGKMLLHKEVKP